MSFAGHVFDMIRRDKENRELRNRRREKSKEIRQKMGEGVFPKDSFQDITSEEFEQIIRDGEEKKKKDQFSFLRLTFLFFFLSVGILLFCFWYFGLIVFP